MASAQTPPTPGGVQDTLPGRRPAPPAAAPEVLVPPSDSKTPLDPNAKRFQVNAFKFAGNTVIPEAELQQLVAEYAGKPLNLYELNKVAEIVTQHYRKRGYALARAVVPAQKVESGVVRIEIIEGKAGKVSVEGNHRYSPEFLGARVKPLAREKVVTARSLERTLLLLNDLPGLTARAVLQPGSEFGTSDVVIQVEEKPLAGTVAFNNHGRKDVGEKRLDGALEVNNPFSIGDQLSLRALYSEHGLLNYGRVGYSLPLNANGTRLGVSYSEVDYDVGGRFAALGISGDARNTEIVLSHPWVRSRTYNLLLGVGARENRSTQTALGAPISDTRISLLSLSALANRIHDDASITTASVVLSTNFKANPNGTRQDAQKAKLDADVSHLRAVGLGWDLFLRGNVALSDDTLADTEKFSIGGPDSVRGYPAAEVRGDRGYQGTVELRRRFTVGEMLGVFNVFADSGWVERVTPGAATSADSLTSYGVGVALFPWKTLLAKIEYAEPADRHPASDGRNNGRWWVSISGRF